MAITLKTPGWLCLQISATAETAIACQRPILMRLKMPELKMRAFDALNGGMCSSAYYAFACFKIGVWGATFPDCEEIVVRNHQGTLGPELIPDRFSPRDFNAMLRIIASPRIE
jgi:hypothetical protein